MGIKHTFVSGVSNAADATKVRPTAWNDNHVIDGDVDFAGFDILNAGNLTGSAVWLIKTSNYSASSGDKIAADTSGGAFTITLPASPTVGDYVQIADSKSTWGTNNLTVAAGGTDTVNSGWSPSDKSVQINLLDNGRTAEHTKSGTSSIARSVAGKASGKGYFEITANFVLGSPSIGVANSSMALDGSYLGQTADGVGLFVNGFIGYNATFANQIATFGLNSVVRFAVDVDNDLFWIATDTGNWNNSGAANPATGAGGLTYAFAATLYPAVNHNSSRDSFTLAVQAADFVHSIPSTFSAWSTSTTTVPTPVGGINSSLVCNYSLQCLTLIYIGGSTGWQILGLETR